MCFDPESNLLVGQCGAEMLLDVGLQHCVEVLELSVSNQTYDVNLADRMEKQTDSCVFTEQQADEKLCTISR